MTGTGYHPEGHIWKPYLGSFKWAKWICRTCAELAKTPHQDTECIDDF